MSKITEKALIEGIICQKEHEFLSTSARIPAIYGVPKIHKDTIDPLYRPIVTMIGCMLEPLSKYIDTF